MPPVGSSGRAAGVGALRASFHEPWVARRAREESRGGGVAERSLALTSSTAGARRPPSPSAYLRILLAPAASRLRVRSPLARGRLGRAYL
eukprot:7479318-Pyramimonas_sp.AAC.1